MRPEHRTLCLQALQHLRHEVGFDAHRPRLPQESWWWQLRRARCAAVPRFPSRGWNGCWPYDYYWPASRNREGEADTIYNRVGLRNCALPTKDFTWFTRGPAIAADR